MGQDSTELDIKAKTRYYFINSRLPAEETGAGRGLWRGNLALKELP
jgi:hypothetical protein